MDTSTISYRVAEFLKKYPPFQGMDDGDVLALAGSGRVRFHERNEHILSQGEGHKHHVFVIQQGVVSLWADTNGVLELRDVRGPGDLLGVERFNGVPASLHSARAATDVVSYALPAEDLGALLDKYPNAKQFVSAYSAVTLDYQAADERRRPENVFLHDVVKSRRVVTCRRQDSIRDAARSMQHHGVDVLAVVDADRASGVISSTDLIAWLADGNGTLDQPVGDLLAGSLTVVAPVASVADGVLAMGATGAPALAITADGTPDGELHALVTPADLASVFGDQPVSILREVRRASTTSALRSLNHRARALALEYLESARSVDWLTRFTSLVDESIVGRVIRLAGGSDDSDSCWALSGASGRGESLTRLTPEPVLITGSRQPGAAEVYRRVTDLLAECDYLPRPTSAEASAFAEATADKTAGRPDQSFDGSFYAASIDEWKDRYVGWVRNPILEQMYLARALFDLRALSDVGRVLPSASARLRQGYGGQALPSGPAEHPFIRDIETAIAGAIDRDFLRITANDCVARLPPLTFFQDAVVDDMGERSTTFQLDRNAVTPLVDVARVYGMAAGRVLGGSTQERFAMARHLLPQHDAIFREAADTLRIVLWLEGRIGIRQGTGGAELPPTLLSRQDRQVLKSGFRVIQRLIELTADYAWLDAV
jgi:CBS domain-containing protein